MSREPIHELLSLLYRHFSSEFEAAMAAAGFDDVTLAHGTNVLRFLDDDGVRIGMLAELSGLSKQAVSQQVAYLQAHGYVTVETDLTDSRAKLVRNTERGVRCRGVARPLFGTIETRWQRQLGRTELNDLRAGLEHATSTLGLSISSRG